MSGLCVERVPIPYEGTTLPGYFYRVGNSHTPRRTLLSLGGFDSTGEELYFFAAAAALQRGYNVLAFEGPGQGEPLRVQHLPARPDYEVPEGQKQRHVYLKGIVNIYYSRESRSLP